MTVGIVIPVYNTGVRLVDTLDSVVGQTVEDWTAVLVDDASTDARTRDICAQYAADGRIVVVRHVRNLGISQARNTGFAALPSKASLVCFMDHDDVWRPWALQLLVAAAARPGVIGAHALAETTDDSGEVVGDFAAYMRDRFQPGPRGFLPLGATDSTTLASAIFVNKVYPPGVLLARREAYERAGRWDPRYKAVQDWDMLTRLLELGPVAYVDEVVLQYRRHDANESGDHARNVAETRDFHVRCFERLTSSYGRRALRRMWRQWEKRKVQEALREQRRPRAAAAVLVHCLRYARGWPSRGPFG